MENRQRFWARLWKDKHGNQTLFLMPNILLWLWLITGLIATLSPESDFKRLLTAFSHCVLFTWSWLELTEGSSYFRNTLGFIVATLTIYNLYRLLS
jgi:hypothetical protein